MYAAPFQQSYPFTRISEKKLTYIREEPYNKNVTNVLKRLNTIQFPVIMDGGDMINKRENVKRGFFFLTFLLFLLMLALPVSASEADSSENAKEYVTVKFCMSDGTTNSTYQAMTVKVVKGTRIRMPGVPSRTGYVNFGWSTKKNASVVLKKAGATCRINRNVTFYAVQRQRFLIAFRNNDGTLWKRVYVYKGQTIQLPVMKNPEGKTFLGWSTVKNCQTRPRYGAREAFTVTKSMHLYAVIYDQKRESNLTAAQIPELSSKYSQLIFVGDSRTRMMQETLAAEGMTSRMENVYFVCKGKMGLSWMKSTGETLLLSQVEKNNSEKPTAIVVNFGVNDLRHSSSFDLDLMIESYLSYWNGLAEKLKEKNCVLFYMSVNPFNSYMHEKYNIRRENELCIFNDALKRRLSSDYVFLDCYSSLMKTGFGYDYQHFGVNSGIDDGLHYTTQTTKRIYRYCLSKVNSRILT